MVRLTVDLIARGTSGLSKKKRDESMTHYLKRLTHLSLEHRHIDDVGEDLGACRNLSVLYLYDNKLEVIPNLNLNGNLTHLYLQNNLITKLDGLNGLTRLSKLYIGGNRISVFEGMEKLSQLQELHIENQKLPTGEKLLFDPRSIIGLSRCLQVLNISGNNIDSIRDLQSLSQMTQFMASDNQLNDMKELAHVLGSWRHLWKLELIGNPVCHKAKYRDRVIIMAPSIESFDSKEVTDTTKQFLRNWQASREALKRKQEAVTRQGSGISDTHMGENGNGEYMASHTTSAASRLGAQVPGYIMPALPRKQFQEVLARSRSQPNSALQGHNSSAGGTYPQSGTRYLNSYGTLYHDPPASAPALHKSHRLSIVQVGSDFASGDSLSQTQPS